MSPISEQVALPSKLWTVVDTNARTARRVHDVPIRSDARGEVILSKSYKLDAQEPTEMEESHAMFFLIDKAFIVRNPEGEIVTPVVKREDGLRLTENDVIATYDELAKEALFKRCKVLAGSQDIQATRTTKEDMIKFLKEKAKPKVGRSRGSENVPDEMTAQELEELVAA